MVPAVPGPGSSRVTPGFLLLSILYAKGCGRKPIFRQMYGRRGLGVYFQKRDNL